MERRADQLTALFKRVKAHMPQHTSRLTDGCWPQGFDERGPEDYRGLRLLERYGPASIKDAIQNALECEAAGAELGIEPAFLGFIEDYWRIGQYVSKLDLRTVIVDVGCCTGLQQVFFSDFAGYIGIDAQLPACAKPLSANARFIRGEFSRLVRSGEFVIEERMFGIANMSILYTADPGPALAEFKRFKRMVLA